MLIHCCPPSPDAVGGWTVLSAEDSGAERGDKTKGGRTEQDRGRRKLSFLIRAILSPIYKLLVFKSFRGLTAKTLKKII